MTNTELKNVYGGGFTFTTTFFNSFSRYIQTVKSIGEAIGSSIKKLLRRR